MNPKQNIATKMLGGIGNAIAPAARAVNTGINSIAAKMAPPVANAQTQPSYFPMNDNYYTPSNPAKRGTPPVNGGSAQTFEQITSPVNSGSHNPYAGTPAQFGGPQFGGPAFTSDPSIGTAQHPILPLVNDSMLNGSYNSFVHQAPGQFKDAADRKAYADFLLQAYQQARTQALNSPQNVWQGNPSFTPNQ